MVAAGEGGQAVVDMLRGFQGLVKNGDNHLSTSAMRMTSSQNFSVDTILSTMILSSTTALLGVGMVSDSVWVWGSGAINLGDPACKLPASVVALHRRLREAASPKV